MTKAKHSPPVVWTDVTSSQISAIAYDEAARVLRVRFKRGSAYVYHDVPPETAKALKEADSVGRYFGEKVRGQFKHSMMEDAA